MSNIPVSEDDEPQRHDRSNNSVRMQEADQTNFPISTTEIFNEKYAQDSSRKKLKN